MKIVKRIISVIGMSVVALSLSSCLGDSNEDYYLVTMPEDTLAYSVHALNDLEIKKGNDFRFQVLSKHQEHYDYDNIKVYANQEIIHKEADEDSSVYSIKNITKNINVMIDLDKYSFNVSFEHDEAYEIDVLSEIIDKIDSGEDLNFKINYDEKYKNPSVLNGNVVIQPNSENIYSVVNVKADVNIKIGESVVKTYLVSSYQDLTKYEILAPVERKVEYGSDFKFQVIPRIDNYYIENMKVLINDVELEVSHDGFYYIRNIKENKMIKIDGLVRIPSYSVSFGRGNSLANYMVERLNFASGAINENTTIEFRLDLMDGYETIEGIVWTERWSSSANQYEKIEEIIPDGNGVYSIKITESIVINATPANLKKYNAVYVVNKNPRFEVEYGLKMYHGSGSFSILTDSSDLIIEEEISLTIVGDAKYSHYTRGTGSFENRYTFYLTDIKGDFTYKINGIYNTHSMGAGNSPFNALFEIEGEIYDISSSAGNEYRIINSEDLVFRIIPKDGKKVGPDGLVVECWTTGIGVQTLTPDEEGFYRIENVTSFLRFYIYGFVDA